MKRTLEEWRPIPGYEGFYSASNHGRVKSLARYVKHSRGGKLLVKGRILATQSDRNGYLSVTLWKDGKSKRHLINRLVLTVFVGPPADPRLHAMHRDSNNINNNLQNLHWGTAKENYADKVKQGTDQKGERHGMSKLTTADVLAIRASSETGPVLGARYGIHRTNVYYIKARKTWAHVQ